MSLTISPEEQPIDVARNLIYAAEPVTKNKVTNYEDRFSLDQLREIADYLYTYVSHNEIKKDDDEV